MCKENFFKEYENCKLCARACGVNRNKGELGFCESTNELRISRAALHMWEEPPISGNNGSGTVFFTGCSLSCIFCQNHSISNSKEISESFYKVVSPRELAQIMIDLQASGAHNINLVTPTHYVPSIIDAVSISKELGLDIPVVYNTGGYDSVDTIKSLQNTVDVYLADYKFFLSSTAGKYSAASNYPQTARAAIAEMYRQVGAVKIENGIMRSGVVVRILLLPSHLAEAKLIVKYLYDTYGDSIYISLMSQYTPMPNLPSPLSRRVSKGEYDELVDYAVSKGIKNAFIQDGESASDSFIPSFGW